VRKKKSSSGRKKKAVILFNNSQIVHWQYMSAAPATFQSCFGDEAPSSHEREAQMGGADVCDSLYSTRMHEGHPQQLRGFCPGCCQGVYSDQARKRLSVDGTYYHAECYEICPSPMRHPPDHLPVVPMPILPSPMVAPMLMYSHPREESPSVGHDANDNLAGNFLSLQAFPFLIALFCLSQPYKKKIVCSATTSGKMK
jgi:hypothetical protein